tara:strand:- start:1589 stop:2989 length:1401 start_codon:yes stop_codon:yes gene_type:complete
MDNYYGEKYRLKPTPEQAEQLAHYFQGSRAIYNYMQWLQNGIKDNIANFYRLLGLAVILSPTASIALVFLRGCLYSKIKKSELDSTLYDDLQSLKAGYCYLTKFDQHKYITVLKKKKEWEWLQEIEVDVLRFASDQVVNAIKRYIKKTGGFPRYKILSSRQSFTLNYASYEALQKTFIKEDGSNYIDLKIRPKGHRKKGKISLIRCKYIQHRLPRSFKNGLVTLSKEADFYYLSFTTSEKKVVANPVKKKRIGLDRNTKNVVALDDFYRGKPNVFCLATNKKGGYINEKLNQSIRRAQKDLSRKYNPKKKRNEQSRNYNKCQLRLQRLHHKQSNTRKDRNNFITTQLARKYDHIIIEDLQLKNMTATAKGTLETPGKNVAAKAGLNKSLLNAGLGQIREQLKWKLDYRGKKLDTVDPRNTSRTCPKCGCIDKKNRPTQALFKCIKCGYNSHADFNAAGNINMKFSC